MKGVLKMLVKLTPERKAWKNNFFQKSKKKFKHGRVFFLTRHLFSEINQKRVARGKLIRNFLI